MLLPNSIEAQNARAEGRALAVRNLKLQSRDQRLGIMEGKGSQTRA
jgi:hypothetical protein